jgi:hypothetical protein
MKLSKIFVIGLLLVFLSLLYLPQDIFDFTEGTKTYTFNNYTIKFFTDNDYKVFDGCSSPYETTKSVCKRTIIGEESLLVNGNSFTCPIYEIWKRPLLKKTCSEYRCTDAYGSLVSRGQTYTAYGSCSPYHTGSDYDITIKNGLAFWVEVYDPSGALVYDGYDLFTDINSSSVTISFDENDPKLIGLLSREIKVLVDDSFYMTLRNFQFNSQYSDYEGVAKFERKKPYVQQEYWTQSELCGSDYNLQTFSTDLYNPSWVSNSSCFTLESCNYSTYIPYCSNGKIYGCWEFLTPLNYSVVGYSSSDCSESYIGSYQDDVIDKELKSVPVQFRPKIIKIGSTSFSGLSLSFGLITLVLFITIKTKKQRRSK